MLTGNISDYIELTAMENAVELLEDLNKNHIPDIGKKNRL